MPKALCCKMQVATILFSINWYWIQRSDWTSWVLIRVLYLNAINVLSWAIFQVQLYLLMKGLSMSSLFPTHINLPLAKMLLFHSWSKEGDTWTGHHPTTGIFSKKSTKKLALINRIEPYTNFKKGSSYSEARK